MKQGISTINLRPFRPGDVRLAHVLSSDLKWPHRPEDWQFALSLGEGVVAERDGKVLGTALSWQWGADYATIGLVIVAPELQGQRIGNRMMQALLDRLGARHVLLHATQAGRGLYERLGFVAMGEVCQHQGMLERSPQPHRREGDHLRPLEEDDIESLIALDARATGMLRTELLRRAFAEDRTVVLERGGQTAGFAVLRRYGRGQAIGPVAAPDLEAASLLISDCCRHVDGFLRVDVHADGGLSQWLQTQGLPCVGGGTVMVRGRVFERGPARGGWVVFTQAIG
ncbi:GNAT family N-acetyltransferase [Variovorax sp. 160MFSha2.1]|uniref:GNAT family N-acetyltransferase n=1 Tax=Variovorax sp. 160MFSha2.1 TaxID=3158367 RepID=UPI003AAC3B4F